MKPQKKYFKGFTLVELIIVITILAILATIAFLSFQNYTRDARDGNRIATIKNIEKGLELFTLKTGNFPTPDNPTTFTGGLEWNTQINQWIIWENVARVINMNTIPLDPNDKSQYVYSTFWQNHLYYQVAINRENLHSSFLPQVYASSKSSIVQWNYTFDPSLPSLIVVPATVGVNGIFDPDVCFVVDGGKNSLDTCVEKKSEMSLRELDSSLVGYWDMETLTNDGKLKDLSGNGNHGGFSGSISPTKTWWLLWHWYFFTWSWLIHTLDEIDYNLSDKISVSIISKTTPVENIFSLLLETSPNANTNSWSFYVTDHYNNICWVGKRTTTSYTRLDFQVPDQTTYWLVKCPNEISIENKYKIMTFVFDFSNPNNNLFYINWKLITTFNHPTHNIRPWIEKMVHRYKVNDKLYIWKRWNWQQNIGIFWVIDDIKIYNRVLSDEEITQQAKIAGLYGQ